MIELQQLNINFECFKFSLFTKSRKLSRVLHISWQHEVPRVPPTRPAGNTRYHVYHLPDQLATQGTKYTTYQLATRGTTCTTYQLASRGIPCTTESNRSRLVYNTGQYKAKAAPYCPRCLTPVPASNAPRLCQLFSSISTWNVTAGI